MAGTGPRRHGVRDERTEPGGDCPDTAEYCKVQTPVLRYLIGENRALRLRPSYQLADGNCAIDVNVNVYLWNPTGPDVCARARAPVDPL